MKKILYLLLFLSIIAFFIASPYILDVLQRKGALEAAGGFSCTEGFTTPILTPCVVSCYPTETCCTGGTLCIMATAPTCLEQNLSGMSAGGQTCGANYLLSAAQAAIVNGSQNVIIGGTTMTSLSVVASEKGCLGCSALINNPKVYAFKNKMKEIINFIIAGKRDK